MLLCHTTIVLLVQYAAASVSDEGVILKSVPCDCKNELKLRCEPDLRSSFECQCLYDTFHFHTYHCYEKSAWETRACEFCDHRRMCNRTLNGHDGRFTCECAPTESFCSQQ